MDEKQLDLNAPLLSVRRLSSTSATSDSLLGKKATEKSRPNRQHSLPLYKSDWELEEVTKPAAVPFLWEQAPGRAKDGKKLIPQPSTEPSNSPRVPPGRLLDMVKRISEVENVNFCNPKIRKAPFNEGMEANEDFKLENEDDIFSDALETLSPTESFSWKCSESSWNFKDKLDIMSFRTFSSDPQTRDYLMSRFIPAAKAMVLETPLYAPKKQPVVPELPKHTKKVYSGELKPLLEQYRSNNRSPYDHYGRDENNDEENDERDGTEKKLTKSCGFFPRLCVKNSLCLLNPAPGLKSKSRSQSPVPSGGEIRRLARTSYSGPLTPTREKHTSSVHRTRSVFQSKEVHEIEYQLSGQSNQFHHSSDPITDSDPPSVYGSRNCGRISPYRNQTPRSPFRDGTSFLGVPKEVQNVEDKMFSTQQRSDISHRRIDNKGSSIGSPVTEKILYIDSGKTLPECRVIKEDKKVSNRVKRGTVIVPKAFISKDVSRPPDCALNLIGQGDRIKGVKVNEDVEQKIKPLECSKVDSDGNLDNGSIKEYDQGNLGVVTPQSPLAPPLPKSPSESWLWRTISLRNPFPKKQGEKITSTGAKWETIVKTSNVHHDHVRYSEELLHHISQHSKT